MAEAVDPATGNAAEIHPALGRPKLDPDDSKALALLAAEEIGRAHV